MKNEKSIRFILEGSNIELVLKNINGEILIDTVPLPSLASIWTEYPASYEEPLVANSRNLNSKGLLFAAAISIFSQVSSL